MVINMMHIDILKPDRMMIDGQAVLRMNQNVQTPLLDLFVRESIQNSLDAFDKTNNQQTPVTVCYDTGNFVNEKLCAELEFPNNELNKKFNAKSYDYISIRDYGTVGLTGDFPKKGSKQFTENIKKLVYDIQKPQENQGAGGSWGIGKTIYFKLGIGLVIYYSRIKKIDGTYESRLAVSLIEDNKSDDSVFYKSITECPQGIIWWGRKHEDITVPETDEKYIEKFLKIFDLKPYSEDETGTAIIIPYVNAKKLLNNVNREIKDDNNNHFKYYWEENLDDFLSICVQRWYAPRLNNRNFRYGKCLKVKINGEEILRDDMEPVFRLVQELYNKANGVDNDNTLKEISIRCNSVEVPVRKFLMEGTTIGNFAYAIVDDRRLKMLEPCNKKSPYAYLNIEKNESRPIICYTRSPGMIIQYADEGRWADQKVLLQDNKYIIGIFVLNTSQKLKKTGEYACHKKFNTVEDYFRSIERSDHLDWVDGVYDNYDPGFVDKIQKYIKRTLKDDFSENVDESKFKKSELSRFLGDILLPPTGFGTRPTGSTDTSVKRSEIMYSRKKGEFSVSTDEIQYEDEKIIIPLNIVISEKKQYKQVSFSISVDSDSRPFTIQEWEEDMGLTSPFEINDFFIEDTNKNSDTYGENTTIKADNNEDILFSKNSFCIKRTSKGTCFGIDILLPEKQSLNIKIKISMTMVNKDVKPKFTYETEK